MSHISSDTSRRLKKSTLIVSCLTIGVKKLGIFPKSISTFGIELSGDDVQHLMSLMWWVILYFGIMFLVHVCLDILNAYREMSLNRSISTAVDNRDRLREGFIIEEENKEKNAIFLIGMIRLGIDVSVPLGLWGWSLILLY